MPIYVQVRKVATGYRVKRFKELLPGLDTETLFTHHPKVLMMDLKKVIRYLKMFSVEALEKLCSTLPLC